MKNIQVPNYPNDFYSFYDGVNISDSEINEWIKECVANLEKYSDAGNWEISSGNTKVHVDKLIYEDLGKTYYYNITVSKGYSDAETNPINNSNIQ